MPHVSLLAVVVIFSTTTPAAADTKQVAALDIAPCLSAYASEIRRLVALELSHSPEAESRHGKWSGRVVCTQSGNVDVWISNSARDVSEKKTLSLSSMDPRVVARTIALAIVELVERSSVEPPRSPGASPPAPREPKRRPPPSRPAPLVSVEASARGFVDAPRPAWGIGLVSRVPLTSRLNLRLGVLTERASISEPLGTVGAQSASVETGLSLRWHSGTVSAASGLGLRLGYLSLTGRPDPDAPVRGQSVRGIWGGPHLTSSGWLSLGQSLRVGLRVELGYTSFVVKGQASKPIWDGVWLAMMGGLGWQF